jgi:hypothetical protein
MKTRVSRSRRCGANLIPTTGHCARLCFKSAATRHASPDARADTGTPCMPECSGSDERLSAMDLSYRRECWRRKVRSLKCEPRFDVGWSHRFDAAQTAARSPVTPHYREFAVFIEVNGLSRIERGGRHHPADRIGHGHRFQFKQEHRASRARDEGRFDRVLSDRTTSRPIATRGDRVIHLNPGVRSPRRRPPYAHRPQFRQPRARRRGQGRRSRRAPLGHP